MRRRRMLTLPPNDVHIEPRFQSHGWACPARPRFACCPPPYPPQRAGEGGEGADADPREDEVPAA